MANYRTMTKPSSAVLVLAGWRFRYPRWRRGPGLPSRALGGQIATGRRFLVWSAASPARSEPRQRPQQSPPRELRPEAKSTRDLQRTVCQGCILIARTQPARSTSSRGSGRPAPPARRRACRSARRQPHRPSVDSADPFLRGGARAERLPVRSNFRNSSRQDSPPPWRTIQRCTSAAASRRPRARFARDAARCGAQGGERALARSCELSADRRLGVSVFRR